MTFAGLVGGEDLHHGTCRGQGLAHSLRTFGEELAILRSERTLAQACRP